MHQILLCSPMAKAVFLRYLNTVESSFSKLFEKQKRSLLSTRANKGNSITEAVALSYQAKKITGVFIEISLRSKNLYE